MAFVDVQEWTRRICATLGRVTPSSGHPSTGVTGKKGEVMTEIRD